MEQKREILTRNGFSYTLFGKKLIITKGSKECASLELQPLINGKLIRFNQLAIDGDTKYILSHPEHNYRGNIEVADGEIAFWIDGAEGVIEEAGYFRRGFVDAILLRTFTSDYHNTFTNYEDNIVKLTTSVIPIDEQRGNKIRTWYMLPPQRAFACKLNDLSPAEPAWFGFSIPGAIPVGSTEIRNKSRTVGVYFKNCYPDNMNGQLPKVYFIDNLLEGDLVLKRHYELTEKIGQVAEKCFYSWWNKPIFCPGIDISENITYDEHGNWILPISTERVLSYVKYMEEKTGINDFTVLIDGVWFPRFGDYTSVNERFGDNQLFRQMVDTLHSWNHKVVLWFSHFAIDSSSKVLERLPAEAVVSYADLERDRAGGLVFDYTHPEVRNIIRESIGFMLSEESGCLNADGIKLDFGFLTPDISQTQFYDSSWGVGDELRAKVNQLIMETAHAVKNDSWVSDTCLEPSVPVDIIRLNDEWTEDHTAWIKRAQRAVTNKNVIIETDGYMMYSKKFTNYIMLAPVIGIPTLYSIKAFNGREAMTEADYRRLHASWNVYLLSPVTPDMHFHIAPDEQLYYRKYTQGPLKGFYSALSYQGHALITYASDKAMITSVRKLMVVVPLPPGKVIKEVRGCTWEDTYEEYSYKDSFESDSIIIQIDDASLKYKWVEILYS